MKKTIFFTLSLIVFSIFSVTVFGAQTRCNIVFNETGNFGSENELITNITASSVPNECNWVGNATRLRVYCNDAAVPFELSSNSATLRFILPNITANHQNSAACYFTFNDTGGVAANVSIVSEWFDGDSGSGSACPIGTQASEWAYSGANSCIISSISTWTLEQNYKTLCMAANQSDRSRYDDYEGSTVATYRMMADGGQIGICSGCWANTTNSQKTTFNNNVIEVICLNTSSASDQTAIWHKNGTMHNTTLSSVSHSDLNKYKVQGEAAFTVYIDEVYASSTYGFIMYPHHLKIGVNLDVVDTAPPTITFYNMTSSGGCGVWNTDKSLNCTTEDTTPTVNITTNEAAYCRIGVNNVNYTALGDQRNCTLGEGTVNHICVLKDFDAITSLGSYIYLSCKDSSGFENATSSTSGPLRMNITPSSETVGDTEIESGISSSSISGATILSNQQIYIRTLTNQQTLGRFDKVAFYGNQRWAFNYISLDESTSQFTNMVNISPSFYVLEIANRTSTNISRQVSAFINMTKQ